MMVSKKKVKKYYYAVGRRKTSSAVVKLFPGRGKNLINEQGFDDYFPGIVNKVAFEAPFSLVDGLGKYHITAKVSGSGKQSQLEAIILAVARALEEVDSKNRPALKKAGLLSVDSRVKERSKPGQAGRARAKKQSPKR